MRKSEFLVGTERRGRRGVEVVPKAEKADEVVLDDPSGELAQFLGFLHGDSVTAAESSLPSPEIDASAVLRSELSIVQSAMLDGEVEERLQRARRVVRKVQAGFASGAFGCVGGCGGHSNSPTSGSGKEDHNDHEHCECGAHFKGKKCPNCGRGVVSKSAKKRQLGLQMMVA